MTSCALLLICLACCALLWGPGVHLWAAREVLARARAKERPTRDEGAVIAHPDPFLYGTVAADMISFKGFGGLRNHCHNWNMRDRMEPLLVSDDRRAFAVGYLCHLAADTSSHNYFVPYHRVAELPPRVLGHAFWESMADALVGADCWPVMEALRRNESLRAFDEIIDLAVSVKALSLRSNRLIFHTLVLGQSRPVWRKAGDLLSRGRPVMSVDETLLDVLKRRILRDMTSVLEGTDWPSLVSQDPSGRIALRAARALRRQLLRQYPQREDALPVARRLARDCFWPEPPFTAAGS